MNYPVINGRRYSWASVAIKLRGQEYTGIKSINYKDSLKPTKVMGVGPFQRGRTKGVYEASGDMELFLQDAAHFRKALAEENASYGLVEFDVLVQFTENDEDPVVEHKVVKCRWAEVDNSNSQGADATTEKASLDVTWIERDGLCLLAPEDRS